MLLGAVAKSFLMTLLAFFLFPIDRYLNQSGSGYCAYALAVTVESSSTQALALTTTVKSLLSELAEQNNGNVTAGPITIFRKQQAPQTLQIEQPSALWIAVNIRECHLLRGDKIVIRGNRGSLNKTIFIAPKNASYAETAWRNVSSFWNHPFLVQGNTVTIEYFPSMMTLMLPLPKQARDKPVILLDSYVFAFPLFPFSSAGSSSNESAAGGVLPAMTESTVGSSSELREAVCFKKSAPKMYETAKSVARLLFRRLDQQDPSSSSMMATVTSFRNSEISFPTREHLPRARRNIGYYCTGWLVGRGNYLMTNYHCLADLPPLIFGGTVSRSQQQQGLHGGVGREGPSWRGFWCLLGDCSSSAGSSGSSSSPSSASSSDSSRSADVTPNETVNPAIVNFMAETKKCHEAGTLGEPAGVIEATKVTIIAANPALDYALLHIDPNDSSVDLARKYGYLQLRATGPRDGEPIYIPQHPNGEPKEIAATKDGRPAVIRVLPDPRMSSSTAASLSSSSDSSSGNSSSTSVSNPLNPNVFYTADTLPGSSGSPVLSQKDNTVVALHHAGGTAPILFRRTNNLTSDLTVGVSSSSASGAGGSLSMSEYNSGIRIDLIIDDMRKKNTIPPCALARSCTKQSKDPCCKVKW